MLYTCDTFYLVSVLSAAASSLKIIIIILFKVDTCVMVRAQAIKSLWCKSNTLGAPSVSHRLEGCKPVMQSIV